MSDGLDHTPPNPEVGLQASIGGYEQARMTALASIGNPTFAPPSYPRTTTYPTGSPAPSPSLAPPADPAPGGGPHDVGAVAPPVVAPPKAPVCPPAPTKPPRRRILKAQLPGKPPKPPSTPPRGTKRDVPGAPRKPRPDASRPPTPPRPLVEAPRSRAPYRATLSSTDRRPCAGPSSRGFPYRATDELVTFPNGKRVHEVFHSIAMMPEYRAFSPDELRLAHYDGRREETLGDANAGPVVETNFMLSSITAMPEYRAFSFEELRMAHHDAAVGGVNAAPAASLVDAGAVAALLRNDGRRWATRVQVAAVAVVEGTIERWRVDVSDGAHKTVAFVAAAASRKAAALCVNAVITVSDWGLGTQDGAEALVLFDFDHVRDCHEAIGAPERRGFVEPPPLRGPAAPAGAFAPAPGAFTVGAPPGADPRSPLGAAGAFTVGAAPAAAAAAFSLGPPALAPAPAATFSLGAALTTPRKAPPPAAAGGFSLGAATTPRKARVGARSFVPRRKPRSSAARRERPPPARPSASPATSPVALASPAPPPPPAVDDDDAAAVDDEYAPAVVCANLLSPDYKKRTFLVAPPPGDSPTTAILPDDGGALFGAAPRKLDDSLGMDLRSSVEVVSPGADRLTRGGIAAILEGDGGSDAAGGFALQVLDVEPLGEGERARLSLSDGAQWSLAVAATPGFDADVAPDAILRVTRCRAGENALSGKKFVDVLAYELVEAAAAVGRRLGAPQEYAWRRRHPDDAFPDMSDDEPEPAASFGFCAELAEVAEPPAGAAAAPGPWRGAVVGASLGGLAALLDGFARSPSRAQRCLDALAVESILVYARDAAVGDAGARPGVGQPFRAVAGAREEREADAARLYASAAAAADRWADVDSLVLAALGVLLAVQRLPGLAAPPPVGTAASALVACRREATKDRGAAATWKVFGAAEDAGGDAPEFVHSATYVGPRPGYFFARDQFCRVGYHRDPSALAPSASTVEEVGAILAKRPGAAPPAADDDEPALTDCGGWSLFDEDAPAVARADEPADDAPDAPPRDDAAHFAAWRSEATATLLARVAVGAMRRALHRASTLGRSAAAELYDRALSLALPEVGEPAVAVVAGREAARYDAAARLALPRDALVAAGALEALAAFPLIDGGAAPDDTPRTTDAAKWERQPDGSWTKDGAKANWLTRSRLDAAKWERQPDGSWTKAGATANCLTAGRLEVAAAERAERNTVKAVVAAAALCASGPLARRARLEFEVHGGVKALRNLSASPLCLGALKAWERASLAAGQAAVLDAVGRGPAVAPLLAFLDRRLKVWGLSDDLRQARDELARTDRSPESVDRLVAAADAADDVKRRYDAHGAAVLATFENYVFQERATLASDRVRYGMSVPGGAVRSVPRLDVSLGCEALEDAYEELGQLMGRIEDEQCALADQAKARARLRFPFDDALVELDDLPHGRFSELGAEVAAGAARIALHRSHLVELEGLGARRYGLGAAFAVAGAPSTAADVGVWVGAAKLSWRPYDKGAFDATLVPIYDTITSLLRDVRSVANLEAAVGVADRDGISAATGAPAPSAVDAIVAEVAHSKKYPCSPRGADALEGLRGLDDAARVAARLKAVRARYYRNMDSHARLSRRVAEARRRYGLAPDDSVVWSSNDARSYSTSALLVAREGANWRVAVDYDPHTGHWRHAAAVRQVDQGTFVVAPSRLKALLPNQTELDKEDPATDEALAKRSTLVALVEARVRARSVDASLGTMRAALVALGDAPPKRRATWRAELAGCGEPARADAARLEGAAAECAAELEDRRDRFRAAHDDVEYFRTRLSSRQGATPAMPDVLDAASLREAFDQADMYREEYELEMDVVENYARRVAALFEARGVPPASRKSPYGFLDDRARRLAGERPPPDASEAWAALPFHDGGAPGFRPGIYEGPPGDLIYQCRSSLLHWTTTWRDVVDCAVCFDRLPRGETLGACVAGVCGHVGGACVSCFREFADQQLGDAAKITEAGLPCFAPHCRAALTPAQLGAYVLGQGPLLSPAKVAKVKTFSRAARVRGPHKCWCPKQCDAVVDLAADARCPECDVAVCPDCRQEAHDGPCADALAGRDAAVWRDKWQRCPDCRNLVEKSAACDHMTCRCGARFCYNCGARGHGCPLECRRPRVFDPKEEDRPKNAAPPRRDDDDY